MLKINKIALSLLFSSSLISAANAQIKTNTAQMQALDKVTGRVEIIEVPVGSEYIFGTFSILARDCQTKPPEETPENYAFIDIVDINFDGTKENIFKGWMISSSPALNAVEHPVYDAWLLKCIDTNIAEDKKFLTTLELEERAKILKKENELSHLKSENPEEPESDVQTPVNSIEDLSPEEQEILRNKLRELGIGSDVSVELIIPNTESDENIDIELDEIEDEEEKKEEYFNEDLYTNDDNPRSLINFK